MSSRSNGSKSAYLGMISIVVFTIAIIVAGEINHLLWRVLDLAEGGEVVVVVLGIKISPFSESSAVQAGESDWPMTGSA
jgi:hypothetical protein